MGQIYIPDPYIPTLMDWGMGIVFILAMAMGPIVALICLFRKSISVFMKRISISAIVLLAFLVFYTLWVYFTSLTHSKVLMTETVLTIIFSIISLLCWTYVLKKKEKPRERCAAILSLGQNERHFG
jgi:hypothetical protein